MSPFLTALLAYLGKAGLPVYPEGQVPRGAAFPYATLPPALPPWGTPTPLTMTCWLREPGAHTARLETADRLRAIIPPEGALIPFPGGQALARPTGDFISLGTDGRDPRLLTLRLRLALTLYHL